MHQYYYDLQIYEDLIYGELEPNRLKGDKIDLGINYLREQFSVCQDMQIVQIHVKKHDLSVLDNQYISNAHPLAHKYFDQHDFKFTNDLEDLIVRKVVNILDLKDEDIEFTISKKKNNIHTIGVCKRSSWEDLPSHRIKYNFYYQLLSECRKKVKRAINQTTFEYSCKEYNSVIANIQKILIKYLGELNNHHEINPYDLNYQVKSEYTNQDCISLIYTSIIEQLNYLYEYHADAFDKSHPVPYYSSKINHNNIEQNMSIILKHVFCNNIDEQLILVIEEQFGRIKNFNHPKKLTYHELDYFILLLNEMSRYLISHLNSQISNDKVIDFLISCKFNNLKFVQYLIREIKKDLDSISDLELKKLYLLERKKTIQQNFQITELSYDPKSTEISLFLKNWIAKETKVVNAYIANSDASKLKCQSNKHKIETTLSAKHLALLIKILYDCDIIEVDSFSQLSRWISANFKSVNQENISIEQSRNHLYNKDPHALEKVKEIAFEMINVINEKLNVKK